MIPCKIGNFSVSEHDPLLIIGGPCVIEGLDHALKHAEAIKTLVEKYGFNFCYKSSYDKANRTSNKSYRGPRLDDGLKILEKVKEELGVPILTDFHLPSEAAEVAEVADVLQVPAFLCRQTDMLEAAAATGKAINVKKGQFLAPWDTKNIVSKLEEFSCQNIMLTERGTTFGYGNLVVDFRSLPIMRSFGHPVIFDGTHSVQRPGGRGQTSGGDRTEVPTLVRAAVAVGVDGIFMEIHEDPDNAPSDGPNMIKLADLDLLLKSIHRLDSLRYSS